MTELHKKILAGLEKSRAAAQKNLKRDAALLKSHGGKAFEVLVRHHKSIIEECKKQISKLKN
jgi:hypothetical protein